MNDVTKSLSGLLNDTNRADFSSLNGKGKTNRRRNYKKKNTVTKLQGLLIFVDIFSNRLFLAIAKPHECGLVVPNERNANADSVKNSHCPWAESKIVLLCVKNN